jgi:predicted RecA/RadA family phage recombinase
MADPITVKITNLNSPIATVKVSNKVAESAVTSVAGRVGDILLTQGDVAGLENVNNTSDLNKPVSIATQAAIDTISLTPGPIGETGPIGPSGIQGLIGPSGSAGLTGPSGIQGPIGPSGTIGLTGPSGLQGLVGPVGPSGSIGLTGPSGADAVVDNTPYGLSWSGDITQAATRDALYDKLETFSLSGHQHIASDITDLADGAISFTNKTLADSSNKIHADQLHFRIKADENLLKGQPVKYDSFNVGQNAINVSLSNQLTDVSIGLAEEDIPQGSFGNIITAGVLDHTDTRDFNEGEILYVDGLGQLTGVEPTSGYSQPIAICLKSQQNNGSLQVLASYPKQPSTDVRNDSNVSGLNVTEALNNLNTSIQSIDIDSFSITGHEHFVSDITDLFTGEFSQTGHDHVVADITDLNTGAFAESVHDHVVADITDLNTGAFAESVHDHVVADITDLNTGAFALSGHNHVVGDVSGIKDSIGFACSDETSSLSVGQAIATDMPYDIVVSRVYASLTAAGSLSATTIDVKKEGSSILNSTLSIVAGTNNAETNLFSGAASTFSLSKGDLLTIDKTAIDAAGTDAGLKVYLEGEIN